MPKKKSSFANIPAVRNPYGFGIAGVSDPLPGSFASEIEGLSHEAQSEYSHIIDNPNLTASQKRRQLELEMGLREPRKKYASDKERKEAAEARKALKKRQRLEAQLAAGISPRVKRTEEEKRETGTGRSLAKRNWNRDMALALPQTASYYGIKLKSTRKESQMDIQALKETMFEELKRDLGYS